LIQNFSVIPDPPAHATMGRRQRRVRQCVEMTAREEFAAALGAIRRCAAFCPKPETVGLLLDPAHAAELTIEGEDTAHRLDLIIVDEAHKMSAYSADKKTLAYQLGEALSQMTDHYLLMTATPHKGDPTNFCLFLSLLDRDVYGDVKSLEDAMARHEAPFYLRRLKEALVTFPEPETGTVRAIFTKRLVRTTPFEINDDEFDLYDRLTRYVEEQSIKAAGEDSARARAVGFTMAMLQRRFASSIYAVRRTLAFTSPLIAATAWPSVAGRAG
jgi:hypothetical protein